MKKIIQLIALVALTILTITSTVQADDGERYIEIAGPTLLTRNVNTGRSGQMTNPNAARYIYGVWYTTGFDHPRPCARPDQTRCYHDPNPMRILLCLAGGNGCVDVSGTREGWTEEFNDVTWYQNGTLVWEFYYLYTGPFQSIGLSPRVQSVNVFWWR